MCIACTLKKIGGPQFLYINATHPVICEGPMVPTQLYVRDLWYPPSYM
jgi:hypothetical protein